MINYIKIAALAFMFASPSMAMANVIPTEDITEFERLYIESKKCQTGCSGIQQLRLLSKDDQLSILTFEMEASSSQDSWVELPFNHKELVLLDTTVNGNQGFAAAINDQIGWLVKKGTSTIRFSVQLQNPKSDIYLLTHVPDIQSQVPAWSLESKDGRQYFKKKEPLEKQGLPSAVMNIQLQPVYVLERQLVLDKKWTLRTTLRPILQQPKNDTLVFDIPLLKGERLLSSEAQKKETSIRVELKSNDAFSWESELEPSTSIAIPAVENLVQNVLVTTQQSWLIRDASVAPYDRPQAPNTKNSLAFWVSQQPLVINTELLKYEAGAAHQVSRSNLHVKNTTGVVEYSLQLELVSSLGGKYKISKPTDLRFEKALINQQEQAVTLENNTLLIDVVPGTNSIQLSFKQTPTMFLWKEPVFVFESTPMNHTVQWENNGQWLWWLGGADLRPSVLLWPILFLITVGVWLARRYQWTKTTPIQNWLLMFGAVQGGWFFISVVVLWMFTLRYKDFLGQNISRKSYNALQIVNMAITVLFFTGLLSIVAYGLLQWPTSLVSGFNSSDKSWTTYTQVLNASSGAWALYLPQSWYRILMLIWATWLAFNVIQWAKLSMEQLVKHDFWKKKPMVLQNSTVEAIKEEQNALPK